jgi:virulence factor Mce-like protein
MSATRQAVRQDATRQLTGLIVIAVVVVVSIGALVGFIGPQMFQGGGHLVDATFANTQQLEPGDEVRISGVIAGTVRQITLNRGAHSSTVQMEIDHDAGPLYANASALLQWKTLLGSAFYIDLSRGSRSAGPLGSAGIPMTRTSGQVELDDVLSVDNGGAKTGLKTMLPQLATALSHPAPLAQSLTTLGRIAPNVATGVGALRGESATRDYDLESLVGRTASTLAALNAPDHQLQSLIQGAAATLGVTAARAEDLETALDAATPAVQQTQTTFHQLNRTLKLAHPLLTKLNAAAPAVAPTFADARPTLTGANTLLHRAVPLLRSLPSATKSLATASQEGLPLLEKITPSLDSLADNVLPYLNAVDPGSQHTTAEMIGPTFEALGPDIAGGEDQNGHFIRFPLTTGSSPLYINCQTYINNPSASQLLACNTLQQSIDDIMDTNLLGSAEGSSGSLLGTTTTPTPTTATPLTSRSPAHAAPTSASRSHAGSVAATASTVASGVATTTKTLGASLGSVLSSVGSSVTHVLGKQP